MAANYIKLDTTKPLPAAMNQHGRSLINAIEGLVSCRDAMIQQRDGPGTLAADYVLLATDSNFTAGGYASANAAAKASFDELDSLLAKLTTDASVSAVKAAIYQFAAKHNIIP